MIDALRQRMKIGYAQAKHALDEANGDLVQALINLEQESRRHRDEFRHRSRSFLDGFKDSAVKASNARVRLKRGEKVLFTFPAPVGALGLVGALASTQLAVLGLVGTGVALANHCSLEIDTTKSEEEEKKTEGFDNVKSGDI